MRFLGGQLWIVLAAVLAPIHTSWSKPASSRPNVVSILADDRSYRV
jgi:hypothetical protein